MTDPVHDPYAPPRLEVQRSARQPKVSVRVFAVLYGVAVAGNVALRATALAVGPAHAAVAAVAEAVLRLGTYVFAVAWLHAAWIAVPASHRGTVSPRRAALTLLIPLYGLYWAYAVNVALCGTLDGILAHAGSRSRAPGMLARIAAGVWLGSFVIVGFLGCWQLLAPAERPARSRPAHSAIGPR